MRPPLKVIAAKEALVNDDVALQGGDRFRFVGRAITATPFAKAKDTDLDLRPLGERFPPVACEYADDAEHRFILKALAKGDLLPCNETTAARAGIAMPRAETVRSRTVKGAE